jgi:hypothetical protein
VESRPDVMLDARSRVTRDEMEIRSSREWREKYKP